MEIWEFDMKIILFGTGVYYRRYRGKIPDNIEVIGLLDNNEKLWNACLDGTVIYPPQEIFSLSFDNVVLLSAKAYEMKEQLLEMGVSEDKILYWREFCAKINRGKYILYGRRIRRSCDKKNILIITETLNYDGGTMAAVYAAMALEKRGYQTVLAAPDGNEILTAELEKKGLFLVICPALPYVYAETLADIRRFDAVIVNVFQMIQCACEISKVIPTLWWIHECSDEYENFYTQTRKMFPAYDSLEKMKKAKVVAVSGIARDNFNLYYPEKIKALLPYGIPDMEDVAESHKNKKLVFAVIGTICKRKAQEVLVKAVSYLGKNERDKAEFWIIGKNNNDGYYKRLRKMTEEIPQIKFLGEMDRARLHNAYSKIDVVICCSMEETMSFTIGEGMMLRKVCITADRTGIAEYLEEGKSGFVFQTGNALELSDRMRWLLHNREKISVIGEKARQTYEKYFTMEKFGERLEDAVTDTIDSYEGALDEKR